MEECWNGEKNHCKSLTTEGKHQIKVKGKQRSYAFIVPKKEKNEKEYLREKGKDPKENFVSACLCCCYNEISETR